MDILFHVPRLSGKIFDNIRIGHLNDNRFSDDNMGDSTGVGSVELGQMSPTSRELKTQQARGNRSVLIVSRPFLPHSLFGICSMLEGIEIPLSFRR
jgi:hypothetical protein